MQRRVLVVEYHSFGFHNVTINFEQNQFGPKCIDLTSTHKASSQHLGNGRATLPGAPWQPGLPWLQRKPASAAVLASVALFVAAAAAGMSSPRNPRHFEGIEGRRNRVASV